MKRLITGLTVLAVLAAGFAALPALTLASVTRPPSAREESILSRHLASPMGTGTALNAVVLMDAVRVTTVAYWVYSVSGGGAGSTIVRVTDGTNNCDCALLCTASQAAGAKRSTCTGACTFAAGVSLSLNVQTATCTTTQPSVIAADVRGVRF